MPESCFSFTVCGTAWMMAFLSVAATANWFAGASSFSSSAAIAFVAGGNSRNHAVSLQRLQSTSVPSTDSTTDPVVLDQKGTTIVGPVLRPSTNSSETGSSSTAFDIACVANPVVLQPTPSNEKWQMYYYGNPGSWANGIKGFLPTGYIGLAESDDGVHWEKVIGKEDYGSMLAPTGQEGDFDGLQIGVGDVIRVGEELHMYYFGGSFEAVVLGEGGPPPAKGLRMRIGRAKSTDNGRSWSRTGQALDYDSSEGLFASWPRIILPENDDDTKPWRMHYHAFNGVRWAAFEATSTDKGDTWTRDGMALGPGPQDAWDGSGVGVRHAVRTKAGELVMVYEAVEGGSQVSAGRHRLGVARWDDKDSVWVKDTSITGVPGGPILDGGVEPLESWTSQVIGTPYLVVADDGSIKLYYCSRTDSSTSMHIGLVESASGKFDPSSWKAVSPRVDRAAEN